MSFHLMNLAWQQDLTHARKIVLLALADLAVQSTGECWPSNRVLSAKCGLSASAVRAQIKALEAAGLVESRERDNLTIYRVKLGVVA